MSAKKRARKAIKQAKRDLANKKKQELYEKFQQKYNKNKAPESLDTPKTTDNKVTIEKEQIEGSVDVAKQEIEANNEIFKDFQDENTKDFNSQNKLIDGIDTKLDNFEQKLFHSQGGDKTALPQNDGESVEGADTPQVNEQVEGSVDEKAQGWIDKLKYGLGFAIGSAASWGMNKIDEYLKDSNDEADKEIESEKEKNAVIDGQITKEQNTLSPSEVERLQAEDVTQAPQTSDGNPYYLKDNPNKSKNPFSKEKPKSTSGYVNNLINSQGSLDEKLAILAELKKRNDVNQSDIQILEEHINNIKGSDINTGDVNLKVNTGNNNLNIQNDKEALKDSNLDKKVLEAKSQTEVMEKLQEESEKEAKAISEAQVDNTNKPTVKKVIQGSMDKLVSYTRGGSNAYSSSSGSNASGASVSGVNGNDGASKVSDYSATSISSNNIGANLPKNPTGAETVTQNEAQVADNKSTPVPVVSSPALTPSVPASVVTNNNTTNNIQLNGASKQLAKDTVGTAPKADTVTNEKVVNNQTVEKIPESSWNRFENGELSKYQDDFLRGN